MALTNAPDFVDGPLTAAKLQQLSDAINERTLLHVVKSADQLYAATTAAQDDTELILALEANSVYVIEFHLAAVGATTGDIKIAWSVPAGATGLRFCVGPAQSSTNRSDTTVVAQASQFATNLNYGPSSATSSCFIREVTTLTTTSAGNVFVQHSQVVSDATASGIKAGSFVLGQKVG